MELTVLSVPGCPHEPLLCERLAEVLTGHPEIRLVRRTVHDQAEAVRLGMRGSPTLLVNGIDPFGAPDMPVGVACRIYRDETGRTDGAPSVTALRDALTRAEAMDTVGRAGRGRVAPAEGGSRAVQRRVLLAFAETGRPPTKRELDDASAPYAADAVLATLHAADFLRLDADGAIRAAYPFSAVPTPHAVEIDGGPRVFAMCAIDALGMAAMLDRDVTIHSSEPGTAAPITVRVPAGRGRAAWEPATTVVFIGRRSDPCAAPSAEAPAEPSVAADVCCEYVNFFTTATSAAQWADAHPEVTGQTVSRDDALRTGAQIFGPLLSTGGRHASTARPTAWSSATSEPHMRRACPGH